MQIACQHHGDGCSGTEGETTAAPTEPATEAAKDIEENCLNLQMWDSWGDGFPDAASE